ncbi:Ig-like domain repeat protein [Tunturiibacter psychrotolerans]|uniref:Ig-like domain repeat protein n=1 Tax=Tunturiibacter psychrotolerans TaxID=3069686 RepID=UPI00333E42B3
MIFSNAGKIATGQVSLVDTANNSTTVASAVLSNNVASISVSTLSAGTHNLVVSVGGDSQNAAITSLPDALTIPTITGTLSGIPPSRRK